MAITDDTGEAIIESDPNAAEDLPIDVRGSMAAADAAFRGHVEIVRQISTELRAHHRIDPGTPVRGVERSDQSSNESQVVLQAPEAPSAEHIQFDAIFAKNLITKFWI